MSRVQQKCGKNREKDINFRKNAERYENMNKKGEKGEYKTSWKYSRL